MEIFGYLSAIAIGISLGLIGGGGSILTVPVLVYLFHVEPLMATTYSLFIVGTTSSVGAIPYLKSKSIDFQTALYFGLPSIITVFLTRHYLLDLIPETFMLTSGWEFNKNQAIMLLFAVLMVFAAYKMIKGKAGEEVNKNSKGNIFSLIVQGSSVGLISGLVGAGGGFLIIPALIIFNHMGMRNAVGTSLVIIACNSLFGFIGNLDLQLIDWPFLLTISVIAIVGILIGARMSQKIDGKKLKPAFGWFVLIMGLVVIMQELIK